MTQKRSIVTGLVVLALIIVIVFWMRSVPSAKVPDSTLADMPAVGMVVVSPGQLQASGIAAQALPLTRFQPQARAYANVVDPGPLLQLRGELRSAQVQTDAARAQAVVSEREYRRLALLNSQDHTVSDKMTEAAQAARDADRAHWQAAQASSRSAVDMARNRWGEVLGKWVLSANSPQLDALTSGQQVLLSVALPMGGQMVAPSPTIHIGLSGTSSQVTAQLISAAPLADSVTQSPTYFYLAPRGILRIGMRVEALLTTGASLSGVVIPDSAVIWYANRSWVYVQSTDTQFVRREIAVNTPAPGGWFVAQWQGGEHVIVKGAALLFSQEFQPKLQAGSPSAGGDGDD